MNENAYRITLPSAGSLPGGFFIVTVQRLGEQREFLLWEKNLGRKIFLPVLCWFQITNREEQKAAAMIAASQVDFDAF